MKTTPSRAGFDSALGSIIAIPGTDQPLLIGARRVTVHEAVEYRDTLTAALHWLGALDDDPDDDAAIPEPSDTRQGLLHCMLNRGHAAPHKFYAHASEDPWAPAEHVPAEQLWEGED